MIVAIRQSRISQWLIAAISLPLAAMPLSAQPDMMIIELCSADGEVRSLTVPIDQEPGEDDCVNHCHACLSRKKATKS